jgi:DNA-directed RNA polymerase specialized sigma24 family protein
MLRLHRRQPTKPGVAHAPDAANEAALVARAKRDRLAFEPLYRTYLGPVYGYCYRRLGSPHAAENVTHHVFAQALDRIATCRDESFRGWRINESLGRVGH